MSETKGSNFVPKIKMLVLSLTGKCNFACRYCYVAEHDDGKYCFGGGRYGGGCFARWFGCEDKAAYGAECAMKRESIKQLKK